MNQIKLYIIIALVVCTMGFMGYQQYQIHNHEITITEQQNNITKLESSNTELTNRASYLKNIIAKHQSISADYKKILKKDRKILLEKERQLRRYKDRQDVVFKKPKLVQRLEQKALDKFFTEIENESL